MLTWVRSVSASFSSTCQLIRPINATGVPRYSRLPGKGGGANSFCALWWGGGSTSNLMLLCAYLMTRVANWRSATIRILAQGKGERPDTTLREMLEHVRIRATIEIVGNPNVEMLVKHSHDAALVFIPMEVHDNEATDYLGTATENLLERLPVVALFHEEQTLDEPEANGQQS